MIHTIKNTSIYTIRVIEMIYSDAKHFFVVVVVVIVVVHIENTSDK